MTAIAFPFRLSPLILKGQVRIMSCEERGGKTMDGYKTRYADIQDWEIVQIGDEYYRFVMASGNSRWGAELTDEDLDHLMDVYHYWKILMDCRFPAYEDMGLLLHSLHFDVIIELFCQRKLGMRQQLRWMFD